MRFLSPQAYEPGAVTQRAIDGAVKHYQNIVRASQEAEARRMHELAKKLLNDDVKKPEKKATPKTLIIGVDIGQVTDPSTFVAIEPRKIDEVVHYYVRKLEVFKLGTSYTNVVQRCAHIHDKLKDDGIPSTWLVDCTGSRPIRDLYLQQNLPIISIMITGAGRSRISSGEAHVSKMELSRVHWI